MYVVDRVSRIDKYLMEEMGISRSLVQKMIDSSYVLVNDYPVKCSYKLKINDVIRVLDGYQEDTRIEAEDIDLDIVYEDEYLLVVNKPSGMVVHPAPGNYHGTLVNALMYHCNHLSHVNGEVRPGIVHRIDKDTSGLLVVAKNDAVHDNLAKQISEKSVTREYLALVDGVIMEDTATIDAPIGRDPNNRKKMCVTDVNAKNAVTHIRVMERYQCATLITCKLETGRTHQIRVHTSYKKHPVYNDTMYGAGQGKVKTEEQVLQSYYLRFAKPFSQEIIELEIEPDEKLSKVLTYFRNRRV